MILIECNTCANFAKTIMLYTPLAFLHVSMTRPCVLRLVKDRIATMLPCFVLSLLGASESKNKAVACFTMIEV
jgi:hypothetical protein